MSSAPRWPSPPPVYTPTHQPHHSSLRPYLTLPYLLSLSWVAYPIISLIFVIFRLQLSSVSAQDAVDDAKRTLLSSCLAAEKAATVAVSLPRYMAISTNKHITDAVNGSLQGARGAFILSLTILEAVIEFIIDAYRSTFLCFVELVIRGGLSILIGAAKEVTDFVNKTIGSAAASIQNDIVAANGVITSAVSGINKLGSPFGLRLDVPQFSVPSLAQLQAIQLPTSFQDSLTKLNQTIPTFDDIREKLDAIIAIPFDLVKKDINDTFSKLDFEVTPLPVPQTSTVLFCSDLDTSVVDSLGQDLVKVAKLGTIILIVLAVLLILGNCALIWFRWRRQQSHLERTRQAWVEDPTLVHSGSAQSHHVMDLSDHNLMTLLAASEHPLMTVWAHKLSAFFRLSPSQTTNLRFIFAYIFHGPALACFTIGFFGLICVQLQLFAVKPIAAHYSTAVADSVADFSNSIAGSLNDRMRNDSLTYANDINGRIFTVESVVNDDLFGWVNGTTSTLNNTLVEFYNEVQSVVEKVFGGTILEQPAQEFIKCILGSKVLAVEHALTFLHDNLHLAIPKVSTEVLLLSNGTISEVAGPISLAAVGSGNADDDDGGIVGKLVARYVRALEKERIMMAIFLGIWLFIVLCALMIVFWDSYISGWVHERRRRRWARSARGGMRHVVVPWGSAAPGSNHSSEPHSRSHLVEADEKGLSPDTLRNEKPAKSTSVSPRDASSTSTVSPRRPHSQADHRAIAWDLLIGSNTTQKVAAAALLRTSPPSEKTNAKVKRETTKLKASGMRALERGEPTLLPDTPPEERERVRGSRAHLLTSQVPASISTVPNSQWFGRLVALGRSISTRKNDGADSDVQSPSPRRHRTKPSLTVDTERASREGKEGQSAWSTSPDAKTGLKLTATATANQEAFSIDSWLPAPPAVADPKRIYISGPRPLTAKSSVTTTKSSDAITTTATSQSTLASQVSNTSSGAVRPVHQRNTSLTSRSPYHIYPIGPPPPLRDVPTSARSTFDGLTYGSGSPRAVGSPRDFGGAAGSDKRNTAMYSAGIRAPGLQAPLMPSSNSRQRQDSAVSSSIPFHLRFPDSPSGPTPAPGSSSVANATPNMNRSRAPSSPDVSAFPWAMDAAPPRLSQSPASPRNSHTRPANPVADISTARGQAANQSNSNAFMRGPPRTHNRTSSVPRLLTIPQHVPSHSRSSSHSISPPHQSSPLREVVARPFAPIVPSTGRTSHSDSRPIPMRKYTNTPIRKLNVINRTPSPTNPFASPFDDSPPIAHRGPGSAPAIVKVSRHMSSRPIVGSTNPFDDLNAAR